jgi:hypothetical protein
MQTGTVGKIVLMSFAGAALVAVSILVKPVALPANATHACHWQTVTGDNRAAFRKSKARKKARDSWTKKARKAVGTNRIKWDGAKNREESCRRPALRWVCRSRAIPCIA